MRDSKTGRAVHKRAPTKAPPCETCWRKDRCDPDYKCKDFRAYLREANVGKTT